MAAVLTQEFNFVTDDLDAVERVIATMVPILFGHNNEYKKLHIRQRPEAAKSYINQESCLWLATLADRRSDYDKKTDESCRSQGDMINMAIGIASEAIKKYEEEFIKVCGDGYCVEFNSDDGSIGTGYRLWHEPYGYHNNLHIGLCHIYYGK